MFKLTAGYEVPPTAGLPLQWHDLLGRGRGDLAQALADWLAIPAPLFTCSGTAALIVALRTLQSLHPDRSGVIIPAFTCPLVALALAHCPGLQPIVCDLAPGGINLDEQQLSQLCNAQTLAVVVTHLAGRVASVASVKRIATAAGALIIEDAAQAMGARQAGRSVGLEGDIGFFSMAFGKGLTSAEGGVLFSRHPQLQAALQVCCRSDLPLHAGWELRRCAELWGYAAFYRPGWLSWFYGRPLRRALARGDAVAAVGDDFTAADIPLHSLGGYRRRVAASALQRLPDYLQRATAQAQQRVARLNQIGLRVLDDAGDGERQGVWPFLLVMMPDQAARDKALRALWAAGLGVTRLFIHPLSGYPAIAPLLTEEHPALNAARFAACTLSISNSHWLDDTRFACILQALRQSVR